MMLALTGATALAQDTAADIYKAKCAMCHGVDGTANTPAGKAMKAPSFSSPAVLKMSDEDMIKITTNGKGNMPAQKGNLSADQIKEAVAYIHTLQKK